MEFFLAASATIISLVSYKYFTRKNRVPELAYPDATEEHIHLYSDEYIRVMNERVSAARTKETQAV